MKATELIGKKAIRTKHVTYAGGCIDRSYMAEPLFIVKVTDTHILCKSEPESENVRILPYEFVDENWTSFDELVSGIENEV